MPEIVGIKFAGNGKSYYFDPKGLQFEQGDGAIVETVRGLEYGTVAIANAEVEDSEIKGTLKPVVRKATDKDRARAEENVELAQKALDICASKIAKHGLKMKLVGAEYTFDRNKVIFSFTADGRVDFRELVKDLVHQYRARIELRQIGVRHETQMIGAVGNCGMVCCCRRYLRKFAPVTIRMAKEQNLFLNPAKISGICGRLLCCLSYEQENYDQFHRSCPRLGKKYQTKKGSMKVLRANMFRNSISVITENNEEMELTLDEWQALESYRPEGPKQTTAKAAPKPQTGDGLLVVSVTPDSVDDPALFADMLPVEAEKETAPPPPPEEGQSRSKRKRKRKPRQEGENRSEAPAAPPAVSPDTPDQG